MLASHYSTKHLLHTSEFFVLRVFLSRVSLCSSGQPETLSVDLELRNLPASASQMLGLNVCTTTAQQVFNFSFKTFYYFDLHSTNVEVREQLRGVRSPHTV